MQLPSTDQTILLEEAWPELFLLRFVIMQVKKIEWHLFDLLNISISSAQWGLSIDDGEYIHMQRFSMFHFLIRPPDTYNFYHERCFLQPPWLLVQWFRDSDMKPCSRMFGF